MIGGTLELNVQYARISFMETSLYMWAMAIGLKLSSIKGRRFCFISNDFSFHHFYSISRSHIVDIDLFADA